VHRQNRRLKNVDTFEEERTLLRKKIGKRWFVVTTI
jgi:hypothetical protein